MSQIPYSVPDAVAVALARGDSPIKVFRQNAGMATATLSALTGIPITRIDEIEAGRTAVADELLIVGRYLGIPADLLLADGAHS